MVCDTVPWLSSMAEVQPTQCLGATITACVAKKMGCLPTQMYLEACHISAWGVTSQGDGGLQASCARTTCPRTLCPPIGTRLWLEGACGLVTLLPPFYQHSQEP